VFTENLMSLKTIDSQVKQNSGRLHNTTGMVIEATRSLEHLIEEF
jgi:hypothetical protein